MPSSERHASSLPRWVGRQGRILGGVLLGLLLLELGLQGLKLGVSRLDAQRRGGGSGAMQVLCLGACYTLGLGLPADQSYPAQLEAQLRDHHPDADLRVVNGGVRGKSVDHFSARIDALLDAHQPEILVVNINRRMDPEPPSAAVPAPLARAWQALILPRGLVQAVEAPAVAEEPLLPDSAELATLRRAAEERPEDPAAWRELSEALMRRELLAAALEAWDAHLRAGDRPAPFALMRRFGLLVGLGRHAQAQQQLAAVRARWPGLAERFADRAASLREERGEASLDIVLHEQLDGAREALLRDDPAAARVLVEQALDRDPDAADGWALLAYLRWLDGEGVPATATLAARTDRELAVDVALGLQPETTAQRGAAEARMEALLDAHLGRIQAAAEARGVRVLVENLASLPEQQRVLERVAARRGLPLVDLQGRLSTHPDAASLFHSTQQLRLSAAGNRWIADQLHATIDAQGWLR